MLYLRSLEINPIRRIGLLVSKHEVENILNLVIGFEVRRVENGNQNRGGWFGKLRSAAPYTNRKQKWLFWAAIGLLLLTLPLSILSSFLSPMIDAKLLPLIALDLALIMYSIFLIVSIIDLLTVLRTPVEDLLSSVKASTGTEVELVNHLLQFKKENLQFALARAELEIEQAEARLGLLAGGAKNTGIVPLLIPPILLVYLNYDVLAPNGSPPLWFLHASLAVIVLLLFPGYMSVRSQVGNRKVALLRIACESKESSDPR